MNQHDDKLITASSLFLQNFNNKAALRKLLAELNNYVMQYIEDPSFDIPTINTYVDLYNKIEERVEFLCQY